MFVLIYGSNGWIGNIFKNFLINNNIDFYCGKTRVNCKKQLMEEINIVQPTHIISFIGRTHGMINNNKITTIDYLEQPGKLAENIRDNLFSPVLLSHICKEKNIHYTYIGTGCIFKFDENHPFEKEENGFTEESLPNFFGSSYSIVKGYTDQIMSLYSDNTLNLRIRMPITGDISERNFITKIVNYEKICSIHNSMSVLPDLLPYVLKMMKQKITGTINLTNPGLISHNEILEMYKEIVNPSFTWCNFSEEEQRTILASERSNNFLDTSKLQSLFPEIRNIKDAVRDCLIEYKKNLLNKPCSYNLLITGGCGFIGSNFINYYFFKNEYNKLVNLDAMYYCADENNIDKKIREHKNYTLIKGNLNDVELVDSILKKYKITHVIHFAAQSHVQNSFEDSIKFTYDNVLGTNNLLECCRKYKTIQKFIHVSTDEVYGESMNSIEELCKTEHSILCPTNPYAATKAGAELIAQSYLHSYKMPIVITRGNNVYGKNQYPEKLIPRFIKLLKENKKVTIQGNGTSVRAFLHAYDTAKAFEIILEKGVIGEIYNIGCDENMEYSVLDIAKILIQKIKHTENYDDYIEYIEDRPYNDMRYYISNQKLKDLGWKIEVDLISGLDDLINNYKINFFDLFITERLNNKLDYFGTWIQDDEKIKKLNDHFIDAEPFEHIIIPDFLSSKYAEKIFNDFPIDIYSGNWHEYNNPIEKKITNDNINDMPMCIKQFFYLLSCKEIIGKIQLLSGIEQLEYDPYLHGAGIHIHKTGGKLDMHLDYEKHPFLNKERRLNIILYMSKNWKEEWNGDTQLWDKDLTKCVSKSPVIFNTALIFKTNEISWHGLPEEIKCPQGILRKTIAYYYVSPLDSKPDINRIGNDGTGYRTKATFKKRPHDEYDELKEKLYKIRPFRLIKNEDLEITK
jgi:dTDP-glucose 4,6-dehydratase